VCYALWGRGLQRGGKAACCQEMGLSGGTPVAGERKKLLPGRAMLCEGGMLGRAAFWREIRAVPGRSAYASPPGQCW